MKKFIIAITAVMLCVAESLAHDVEIDGIYYNLDKINKTAGVTYRGDYESSYNEYSGSVTIPETITYNSETYSVTSIGEAAFDGSRGLTSVTIPNSVTSIGNHAFLYCSGLTKVNYLGTVDKWVEIDFEYFDSNPTYYAKDLYINNELLTNVKLTSTDSIKNYAFYNCQSIKSVEIGNSVKYIGAVAFALCGSLTSVTIGNNVTSIGDWAFDDCHGLTEIIVLSSNKSFVSDNGVLFNNDQTKLIKYPSGKNPTTYEIPNYVTSIGNGAFANCSGLTEVTIPNHVTSIGRDAFYNCSGLTKVNYLGNVDKWVEFDFENSGSNPTYYAKDLYINNELLTDVKITTADSIKNCAFYNCQSIKSVEIGNHVTSIGSNAFNNCSGLTKVNYLGTVDKWVEIDFNSDRSTPTHYAKDLYINNELLTDVKITTADSIKNYAFYNCQSIKSVEIGNSVTSIGRDAFYNCSGLTKVNYLGTVDKWVEFDFENSGSNPTCYAKDLYINDELLADVKITSAGSIKNYAFYNCQSIKSVEIGNSVISIGYGAFNGTGIYNNESNWDNGVLYIDNCLIDANSDVVKGSYTIKEGTRIIGRDAFSNCRGLTSVTIPNSVTSIGRWAFSDCRGLTKVNYLGTVDKWVEIDFENFGSNPTYYAKDLYINNELLTDVKITTADSIKNYAFYNCQSIKSVEIGNSVTSIGEYAFVDCSGLTSVTIPNSVTSIGEHAFNRCSGLISVTIPNSVTSIGFAAFADCSGLTSVTIPNSVTSIGYFAFSGCSGLTSVTIPNNVTSIGGYAFSDCNNLKTVYNCSSLDIVKGKSTNGYVAYYADEVINGCPVGDFIVNYEDEIIEYIGDTTVNKIEIPEFVTGIEPDVFASCANIDTIVWNAIDCADFTETTAPFNAQAAQIKSVIFGNNVEYIPAYLCSDMTLLTEISIPGEVNSIGENAFVGCSRLRYITSYPTLVPLAKESSFNSYSAYLYIPCDYYDYYYLDDVFGKFKEIKCISAEEVEGSEKVEIEVDSNNNATIKWPSTGNASSYEIVISKNGEVFCTLLFNENGQLTSIDFGNRSASVGFQFTVTGLDGASKYSYSIVAKDEKGNELESYNGTFTTNGYSEETAILETLADANITITGGTISADTDFTIYNTIGQNVTAKNGSLTPGVYVVKVGDDIAKVMVK